MASCAASRHMVQVTQVWLAVSRHAQHQLQDADSRVQAMYQESVSVKEENQLLRQRVAELEQQLGIAPQQQQLLLLGDETGAPALNEDTELMRSFEEQQGDGPVDAGHTELDPSKGNNVNVDHAVGSICS